MFFSVTEGNMRGMRPELGHANDQHTSNRGDWTGANTHDSAFVHRPHPRETPNCSHVDRPCVQKLSRSTIESTDITTCRYGDSNFGTEHNDDDDECDGSSFYELVHEKMVEMTALASAIGDKTQARHRSAQCAMLGTRVPLSLSPGVRFENHADGTTGSRNHPANVTVKRSTTCDVAGNRTRDIEQDELEFNCYGGDDSSSDSRLSDSCPADESDASVDDFMSSSGTSETSFSRRVDDNTTEATIPVIDVPALQSPCPSSSRVRFGHTSTPTETRSSLHRVPSRSNLNLNATTDNTDFRRTDGNALGQFDRVAELRDLPVDARMKGPQCSPSCSDCGCHVGRPRSTIDQHSPAKSPIPDRHRFVYNSPARREAIRDSISSSSMLSPENVHCRPTDVTLLDRYPSVNSDTTTFENTYPTITPSHQSLRTNHASEIGVIPRESAEFISDRTMQHRRGRTKRNIAERRRRMDNLEHVHPAEYTSSLNSSSNNIYGIASPSSSYICPMITRGHALCRIPRLIDVLKSYHSDDARSVNASANNSRVIPSTSSCSTTCHHHAPSRIPRLEVIYKSKTTDAAIASNRKSRIPVRVDNARSSPIRTSLNSRVISGLAARVVWKRFNDNARAAVFVRWFGETP